MSEALNQEAIEIIFDTMIEELLKVTDTCPCAVPDMLIQLAFTMAETQECVPYCQISETMQNKFFEMKGYFKSRHLSGIAK